MHRLLSAVAFATGLLLAGSGSVQAAGLVTVSGPSPLSACVVPAVGGTIFPNAEVEPFVAANPATPGNLIGAFQQDRWSNGGAHGLVAASSSTGGASWSETPLPFNRCVAGGLPYERASDPWVSIGPDGIAYTVSISFNLSNNDNGVFAMTSGDGGQTWGKLRGLKVDNNQNQFFNDKESVTADPVKKRTAYAVWDRLVGPTNNAAVEAHNFFAFTGPTWFSMTTDGGNTWSTAQIIVNTGQNDQTIGNQIVVDPQTGAIYDFFDLIITTKSNATMVHGFNNAFVKSTDGGNTWSQPQIVDKLESVRVTDPNTGAALRTADFDAAPAIDPATGQLYLTWEDARFTGGKFDQVVLTTSTNGGASWSPLSVINKVLTAPAFTPAISVNSVGAVAVTYYDFRNLASDNTSTLPTDYWITFSTDGGASFGQEQHVAGSFNMLVAPSAGGFFVGDYEGLASAGTAFQPFFVATNCTDFSCTDNRTDVFSTTF